MNLKQVSSFLKNKIIFYKSNAEILIVIIVFVSMFHRLLGFFATWYLKKILGGENGGKFDLNFSWIALRLGLDQNQILISQLIWKNPSNFLSTPYFFKIEDISITFDFLSVFRSILMGNKKVSIKIEEIKIGDIKVYIEKTQNKEDGMNIWACFGAKNQEEEKKVKSSITKKMASVVEFTSQATIGVGKKFVKYNPGSLIYKGAYKAGKSLGNQLKASHINSGCGKLFKIHFFRVSFYS